MVRKMEGRKRTSNATECLVGKTDIERKDIKMVKDYKRKWN